MATVRESGVRQRLIVVGVIDDLCSGSLAYALQMALSEPARIRVVRVSDPCNPSRASMRLPVHTVEASGDPLGVLVEESRAADLLVVETSPDTRVVVGDQVLAQLRCQTESLLVEVDQSGEIVRASGPDGWAYSATPDLTPAVPPVAPASGRFISVGVDSSPASDAAVRWAAAMAIRTSSSLQLVSVYGGDSAGAQRTERDASDDTRAAAALVRGVTATSAVARGEAAEVLLDAARGAEMLVIGRHSTRGLIHSALGSVGDTCARLADCPVVIVPVAASRPD